MTKVLVLSIKDYIESDVFEIPQTPMIFSARRSCGFSSQGEEMVYSLIKVAPSCALIFDGVFPPEEQERVLSEVFSKLKAAYAASNPSHGKGKAFFETNRSFKRAVPAQYRRSKAPRLTTKGNTFHGMKKNMLLESLRAFCILSDGKFVFFEIDMGAAHTRVARFLKADSESQLDN
jgi:hypothetical protein